MKIHHEGFVYEITRSRAVLAGFDKDNMPDLSYRHSIPQVVGGCPVVGVAPKAFLQSKLKWITLPSTIFEIGEFAFAGSFLEGIWFLSSINNLPAVLNIGEHAFEGCINLNVFNTNKALSLSPSAFYGCSSLNSADNHLRIISLDTNSFTNCYYVTSLAIVNDGILKRNCFMGSAIKELFVENNLHFEHGVVEDLINYGILVKTTVDSPLLELAYLGVKAIEQSPF